MMERAKELQKRFSSTDDAIEACKLVIEVAKISSTKNLIEFNNLLLILKDAKRKEGFDWDKLLNFINGRTGKKYKVINAKVKRKYSALLKQGYTKEDIQNAVNNALKMEHHKSSNYVHLTPEFFSRTDIIDKYGAKSEQIKKAYNGNS